MALTTPEVLSLITNNPNTLQQVLDYNHDLVNGIVQIGTNAGSASPSLNQISIGQDALNSSLGNKAGCIGIGYTAGQNSNGIRNVIIGYGAGVNFGGQASVVLGPSAGQGAVSENSSVILGSGASASSIGINNIHIGSGVANESGTGVVPNGVIHNIFLGAIALSLQIHQLQNNLALVAKL